MLDEFVFKNREFRSEEEELFLSQTLWRLIDNQVGGFHLKNLERPQIG